MMSNFKKAQKGNAQELENILKENIKDVYFMLKTMLGEGQKTESATVSIFKKILPQVFNKEINSDTELSSALIMEAAKYCKRILDKEYKAFKVPKNGNYLYSSYDDLSITQNDNMCGIVLKALPMFHKFVYLLRYIYNYETKQISEIIKINADTIDVILNAEEVHLGRIEIAAKNKGCLAKTINADEFHMKLLTMKNNADLPNNIVKTIFLMADKLSAPIKAKETKKKIKITLIAVLSLLIVGIIAGTFIHTNSFTSTEAIGGADGETDITITDNTNTEADISVTDSSNTGDMHDASSNEEFTHHADIQIENHGTITIGLNGNVAPKTVENFVKLANEGFYDGLTFHRIMDGFMMQGGDPNGDGTGGSDENVVGEFSENGYENNISHTRGTISMARSSDYDSGSSQFFIVHEDSTFLDGQYAAFGQVTEGMDIVDEICTKSNPTDDNGTIPKEEQPVISSITIR